MTTKLDFWSLVTSRIFFAIAAVMLTVVGIGVTRSLIRRAEVQKEVTALQQEIRTLEGKNEEFRRFINYYNTPEFREREARLRLGLQKPGEKVVVIPNLSSINSPPAAQAAAEQENKVSNWRLWLEYFWGR
ncbi:MAG: septum formation initiator family protein [Candidatus Kerfeldbacteria bacterium]|nr:septum formation initiator family protein [Candidatus Kerfeldbacteria bacterium]